MALERSAAVASGVAAADLVGGQGTWARSPNHERNRGRVVPASMGCRSVWAAAILRNQSGPHRRLDRSIGPVRFFSSEHDLHVAETFRGCVRVRSIWRVAAPKPRTLDYIERNLVGLLCRTRVVVAWRRCI